MRQLMIPLNDRLKKYNKAVESDGIRRIWAKGVFNGSQLDKCDYLVEGDGKDRFTKEVSFAKKNPPKVDFFYGEIPNGYYPIFDGDNWMSLLPDVDESKLEHGPVLKTNEFLSGLKKLLDTYDIRRLYCSGIFDGEERYGMTVYADTYNVDACQRVARYLDNSTQNIDDRTICIPTRFWSDYRDVVYNDGVFYSKEM